MKNDNDGIETTLSQTPQFKMPDGLSERLETDFSEFARSSEGYGATMGAPTFWQRMKFPALVFGLLGAFAASSYPLFFGSNNPVAKENQTLRREVEHYDPLTERNREFHRLNTVEMRWNELQSQLGEMKSLRLQIQDYQMQLSELESIELKCATLLAEIEKLEIREQELVAENPAMQNLKCVEQLKKVGLAGRVWSLDYDEFYPENFMVMSNELVKTELLICPSDENRHPAGSWPALTSANITYQMETKGGKQALDPSTIFVICPIHGHVVLSDGSVQHGLLSQETIQRLGQRTFRDKDGILKMKR